MKTDDIDVVWDGRSPLSDSLERDYADMRGDGWDLWWQPTSPLTTPWDDIIASRGVLLDPDQYVPAKIDKQKNGAILRAEAHELRSEFAQQDLASTKELTYVSRRGPARKAKRILKEWLPGGEQHGSTLTSGGHWRVSQRAMRARKR